MGNVIGATGARSQEFRGGLTTVGQFSTFEHYVLYAHLSLRTYLYKAFLNIHIQDSLFSQII